MPARFLGFGTYSTRENLGTYYLIAPRRQIPLFLCIQKYPTGKSTSLTRGFDYVEVFIIETVKELMFSYSAD